MDGWGVFDQKHRSRCTFFFAGVGRSGGLPGQHGDSITRLGGKEPLSFGTVVYTINSID